MTLQEAMVIKGIIKLFIKKKTVKPWVW
jgi:hypothetical protein